MTQTINKSQERFSLGAGYAGLSTLGITSMDDWQKFQKASAQSSYETNPLAMNGITALRPESLETTLRTVVADLDDILFFKQLKRKPVKSAVHQWILQTSLGGQLGAMANTELGDVQFDIGEYKRMVANVKILTTGVSISHFATVQDLVVDDYMAQAHQDATTRIVVSAEINCYHGNPDVAPDQFSGFDHQIAKQHPENIIDCRGITDVNQLMKEVIFRYKAKVRQMGSYGDLTNLHVDNFMANAIDTHLFPQYRVQMGNNPTDLTMGSHVSRIKASTGFIDIDETLYADNPENSYPKEVLYNTVPDNAPLPPVITVTAQASVNGSKWKDADQAGTYYIVVAGIGRGGAEGLCSAQVSGTVAVNGALRIQITKNAMTNASNNPTGWAVYISEKDPADLPDLKDFRLVERIPAANGNTTTWDHKLEKIAGTSTIRAINFSPKKKAIEWIQLYPIFKFPLGTLTKLAYNWAVGMYGAPVLNIPFQHFVFENLQIADVGWNQFGKAS